jgi:nucleotide sugar dehydrogenase
MKVTIVGAGKMGLPLACHMASRGLVVLAADCRQAVVDAINQGVSHVDEPGVAELLATTVQQGRLKATTDTTAAVRDSDVVVIIVPAVLTDDCHADLAALESVTRDVALAIHPGLLISYETTVPVGTTRNRFLSLLEMSGAKAGRDFHLAYSPERLKSNLVLARISVNPKVVGGVNEASAHWAEAFYRQALGAPVINVQTLENAEMVKLAGMIYRDVNIALANELARYAEATGIDLSALIEAVNTDGEANMLIPGIGVGGHCAPVYPYFVIHHARDLRLGAILAEQARHINDGQASHAVARLEAAIGSLRGLETLILGLAFRPQVKEHFYSTSFLLRDELARREALVTIHDSLYSPEELRAHGFEPGRLDGERAPAVIVLSTAHKEYIRLDFASLAHRGLRAVIDGRNLWDPAEIRGHGLLYFGIGRP